MQQSAPGGGGTGSNGVQSSWDLTHQQAGSSKHQPAAGPGRDVAEHATPTGQLVGASLSEALEGFFRDGMAAEEEGLGPSPPPRLGLQAEWGPPQPPSAASNSEPAGHHPATSDDDFTQLFHFDAASLALEDVLPHDFLHGAEGDELLGSAFEDLMSPGGGATPEAPAPKGQQGGDPQRDLQRVADTARSVLEALGEPQHQPTSPGMASANQRASPAGAPSPGLCGVQSPAAQPPTSAQAAPAAAIVGSAVESWPPPPMAHHHHESLMDLLNSDTEGEAGMEGAGLLPSPGLPSPLQPLLQPLPPPPPAAAPAPAGLQYQVVSPAPLYVDPRTGQLLTAIPAPAAAPAYHSWGSPPMQLAADGRLVAVQGQPLGLLGAQPVQFLVAPQPHAPGGGMHAGPGAAQLIPMPSSHAGAPARPAPGPGQYSQPRTQVMAATGEAQRRQLAKRKSDQVLAAEEMASDRSARLAQGFSYDPSSGRFLRHGPAMAAAALHDKDVPAVTALFAAYARQPFSPAATPAPSFSSSGQGTPPTQNTVPGGAQAYGGAPAPPAMHVVHGGAVVQQHLHLQHQVAAAAAAAVAAAAAAAASASSVRHNPLQAALGPAAPGYPATPASVPPRAQQQQPQVPEQALSIGQSWGHSPQHAPQQSSATMAPAPSGRQILPQTGHGAIRDLVIRELQSSSAPPQPAPPPATKEGGGVGLRGVSRDKWSLFWDATYISEHPESSLLSGFKQEAIYLGKFPSSEQAGRAHDLLALKLAGPAAQTNFPPASYERVMPMLRAHSGEALVAAIRKDSELACARTSKHRGVRRVGPGQYEARVSEGAPEGAAPPGGPQASDT